MSNEWTHLLYVCEFALNISPDERVAQVYTILPYTGAQDSKGDVEDIIGQG